MVSACSTTPENVQANYVSPLEYHAYDCDQIAQEMRRVGRRVREVAGHQQDEATNDAIAMGVGLVVFFPALFFLPGGDKEEELARLKGESEALEQAAIGKNCETLLRQIEQERAAAELRENGESEDSQDQP